MKRVLTLIVAGVLITTAFGASAFTTGYADRTATIDVVADDSGLIGLEDGNTGNLVGASGDQLTINFANETASGANTDAYFEVGDPATGNETYAFNITNNDADAQTLELNYTMDNNPDTNTSVTFEVYDGSNTQVLTASEEGAGTSATDAFASGETVYVVIKVDTSGLTSTENLSGTLRVKLS